MVSQSVLFFGARIGVAPASPGPNKRMWSEARDVEAMIECRLIGGVGLYACHDEVIDIHSGKEGFMGFAPGNIFVFDSDTGWDLSRPADFPRFGNLHVGHHGLPFGQDISRLYSGVSVGKCGSYGHDSPVTWRTSPAEGQPNVCH